MDPASPTLQHKGSRVALDREFSTSEEQTVILDCKDEEDNVEELTGQVDWLKKTLMKKILQALDQRKRNLRQLQKTKKLIMKRRYERKHRWFKAGVGRWFVAAIKDLKASI